MLSPYTNEAAATFKRATDNRNTWEPNKIYKNSYGRHYYINNRGYLHVYGLTKSKFHGRIYYCITDLMLTKDNTLRACKHSKDFDSNEKAQQYFREFYLNEGDQEQ